MKAILQVRCKIENGQACETPIIQSVKENQNEQNGNYQNVEKEGKETKDK